jgi:hypothetical protein
LKSNGRVRETHHYQDDQIIGAFHTPYKTFCQEQAMNRRIIALVGAFFALLASPIVLQHLCFLKSSLIEFVLTFCIMIFAYFWISFSQLNRTAWKRVFYVTLFSLIANIIYLSWLHSDYFPRFLLDKSSIEHINKAASIKQKAALDEH